jgi:hypothetical protein
MECERCQGIMCEERLVVRDGLVKIKNMTAWHCMQCGRTQYRCISPHQDFNPCTKHYPDRTEGSPAHGARSKHKEG